MNRTISAIPMPSDPSPLVHLPDGFARLIAELRPRLHRYCARMAGSALDGEDIVQEALAKASLHYDPAVVRQPEAWMFRIAHNTAMDFLRHRALERQVFADVPEEDAAASQETTDLHAAAEAAAVALETFMQLPPSQRSAVILGDVLGHAPQETAELLGASVPAVKAALHRGRARLRELGRLGGEAPAPALSAEARSLARLYAQRFNLRDFDGLRSMLAEEVRLQLHGRLALRGRAEVSNYFGNYARLQPSRAEEAVIEGRPGIWIHDGGPPYAVVLLPAGEEIAEIRDFRYARYVCETLIK